MTPDPQKCLSESRRVLQDGGVLSCSSWQGSEWLDLMRLISRIRPDKKLPDLPKEWNDVNSIKGELEKAGFRDVESHQVETTMRFDKVEDLSGILFKLPHMVMMMNDFSEDETTRFKELMMDEARKLALHDPGELKGIALVAVGRK